MCANNSCFISVVLFKLRQIVDASTLSINKQQQWGQSRIHWPRKVLAQTLLRLLHSTRTLPPSSNSFSLSLSLAAPSTPYSGQTICSLVCLPNLTPGNFYTVFYNFFDIIFCFFGCTFSCRTPFSFLTFFSCFCCSIFS